MMTILIRGARIEKRENLYETLMLELNALAECTLQTLEDDNDHRVRSSSPFIYKGSPPNPPKLEIPGMPSRTLEV